jgi:hypothetical protein
MLGNKTTDFQCGFFICSRRMLLKAADAHASSPLIERPTPRIVAPSSTLAAHYGPKITIQLERRFGDNMIERRKSQILVGYNHASDSWQ